MPGIVGIIGAGRPETVHAALAPMVEGMAREVFYCSGHWLHERLGVGLGWVCHQDAFADCMPVWNARRDICLVFTGESFIDEGQIDALKSNGHKFNADSASYLVSLYEEMGPKFVEALNGSFSGVLVDTRKEAIILFNDRYALNRVYVHENADGTYFSSEAKSLLRVLPAVRRLDPVGFAEVLSCGCALQDRTLFSGVSLLPPASRWTFSRGRLPRREVYFRKAEWENLPLLRGAEYYEKLKETVSRVLPRYFGGRKRIGMSLTGGLDSRIIMAWARRPAGTLPCYTFTGPYRDCSDATIAGDVARSCGQPHQTIPVGDQFLDQFPALAERVVYLADGSMDVTGSVELYVNQIARRIAPVRLTGNYGSEILRRNVAFKPQQLNPAVYDSEIVQLGRAAASTYAREKECHPLSFIAFKQVPWHHHSRLAVEESQLTMRAPFLDNELVRLAYQASPTLAVSRESSLHLIADGNPALSRIPTDRGVLYQPKPILTKLQNLYQELTFRAEYAFDYGMPQWLARIDHAFAPLCLERIFLGRHKFAHFRVWYRGRLAPYLKEVLLDPRTRSRPHLRGGRLEELIAQHLKGQRNYTTELHALLTIELIYRKLIEQ
jgi:asparagine synthase (glutamine-hydrolysing)